jgi:hypothetical protein
VILLEGNIGERIKALRKIVRHLREAATPRLPEAQLEGIEAASGTTLGENLKRVIQANSIAGLKFVPKPYGGSAVIFRSSRARSYPYSDDYLGWKLVIRGDTECFEIEADHESIFDGTAVRLIAEKLDAKLVKL